MDKTIHQGGEFQVNIYFKLNIKSATEQELRTYLSQVRGVREIETHANYAEIFTPEDRSVRDEEEWDLSYCIGYDTEADAKLDEANFQLLIDNLPDVEFAVDRCWVQF